MIAHRRRAGSPAGCGTPIITTATTAARHLCLHRADVHEVEDARDWPEDREIDGTLCRRLSPEYFAWLRSPHAHGPSRAQGRKAPRGCLEHAGSDSTPAGAGHPGVRQGTLQEVLHSFSRRTINHPRFVPEPQGETRRSSQKGLDLSRNQA